MNFADTLKIAIIALTTLTTFLVVNGLVSSVIRCWSDVSRKYSKEHQKTLAIINQVSEALLEVVELPDETEAILSSLEPLESPVTVTEEDPWIAPLNPVEKAIATIKAQSTKPEILLLAAPKKLTKTEVNKAKKDQLEAWCNFWNCPLGTVTTMKNELKRVAC